MGQIQVVAGVSVNVALSQLGLDEASRQYTMQ